MLTGDMYGAPYDLLGDALAVRPHRLWAITSRWRRAGFVESGADQLWPGLVLAHHGRDARCRVTVPPRRHRQPSGRDRRLGRQRL
jgi:hypothetical protein